MNIINLFGKKMSLMVLSNCFRWHVKEFTSNHPFAKSFTCARVCAPIYVHEILKRKVQGLSEDY